MSNSLATVHSELISEWSDKNHPLTPDKITFGSNKKVWWKGSCGHEWQTSVKARSNGEKCPICAGARVVKGINDLTTLKPEIAKEWSEKNIVKPTTVSLGSHKKVIWRCKHGHEREATVKSRTINGTGCPICSHNTVLEGFNDLASQFPSLAAEWSERNFPLKPTIVWNFHSLLLGIQMMFSFMLTDEQKPLRLCKHCTKAFVASRPNAMFCSPRCKNHYNVYKSCAKDREQEK